jgi:Kef-type K+ transport system membrane component KefB
MSVTEVTFRLILTLVAVTVVGRVMGRLFRAIGQPPVVGEVIGGILLGPSLLGAIWPSAYQVILPPAVVPALGVVAEIGVVFYMFIVGLELNTDVIRGQLGSTMVIAETSMAVPFTLGAVLAVWLHPALSPAAVPVTSFVLFFGVAMSVTAFPVLARILADRGLSRTELGVRALTCAAIADVTAWCALALVVGIIQASPGRALGVALLSGLFVFAMLVVVRPVVARWIRRADVRGATPAALGVTLVAMLGCAWLTDTIGIHAIIGAFLAGAVIPHDSRLAHALVDRFERPVTVLVLPAFFAFMGLKTEVGLISGISGWMYCGLIVLVATVGKVGGTFAAAAAAGSTARSALALGVLMNTRGLMELIVLNIGLELGVISPTLFTMLVVMAIVTTLLTAPLLRWLTVEARTVG